MRRVVVTGMGVVSALGCDLGTAWDRLHVFKNAVTYSTDMEKYKGLNARLYRF